MASCDLFCKDCNLECDIYKDKTVDKHILCRTINNLDDIVIVYQLYQAEVIRVSSDNENEVILTLCTNKDKIVQIHLRNDA